MKQLTEVVNVQQQRLGEIVNVQAQTKAVPPQPPPMPSSLGNGGGFGFVSPARQVVGFRMVLEVPHLFRERSAL